MVGFAVSENIRLHARVAYSVEVTAILPGRLQQEEPSSTLTLTHLLIIGLLNILCFPLPSNFPSFFKQAMNNEASLASSFVQVTMSACQAKASDTLFQ